MDEQKEIVTSFDPKTGKSTEVNVVLDHVLEWWDGYPTYSELKKNNRLSAKFKGCLWGIGTGWFNIAQSLSA